MELPETIGQYSIDLPHKIEQEYRQFLEEVWKAYSDTPLVLEEQTLRHLMAGPKRELLEDAYKKALRITALERITGTNHKDVTYYKGLLYAYTKELLTIMRLDFLEEITGRHIEAKAFDEP